MFLRCSQVSEQLLFRIKNSPYVVHTGDGGTMNYLDLPEDVHQDIFEYLYVDSLVALEQSCKRLRRLACQFIWRNMFLYAQPTPSYCHPLPRYIASDDDMDESMFYLDEVNLTKRFVNISNVESIDKFFRALMEPNNEILLENLNCVQTMTIYLTSFIPQLPIGIDNGFDLEEIKNDHFLQVNWIFQHIIPSHCKNLQRIDIEFNAREGGPQNKTIQFLADILAKKYAGVEKNFKITVDSDMDLISFYQMISDGTCRILHMLVSYVFYPVLLELIRSFSLPRSILRFEIGWISHRPSGQMKVENDAFKRFLSAAPNLTALSVTRLQFESSIVDWVPPSVRHLHLYQNNTPDTTNTGSPPIIENIVSLDTMLAANSDTFDKLSLPNLRRLDFSKTSLEDIDWVTTNLFRQSHHIRQLHCRFMTYVQAASVVKACGSSLRSLDFESVTHPGPNIDLDVIELVSALKSCDIRFLKLPIPKYYGMSLRELVSRILESCTNLNVCYLEGPAIEGAYLHRVKATPYYVFDGYSKILLDGAMLYKLDVSLFKWVENVIVGQHRINPDVILPPPSVLTSTT